MVPPGFVEKDEGRKFKNQKKQTVIVEDGSYTYPESSIVYFVFSIQTGP
jgi:hypothetical protein